MRKVHGRKLFMTKATGVRLSQDVACEEFEFDRRWGAESIEKLRYQDLPLTAQRFGQKSQRLLIATGGQCVQLRFQFTESGFPGYFIELPGTALSRPFQRVLNAIRMISNLN